MEVSSVSQIKKELQTLDEKRLVELCLRLAKYKKDNKELLNYILFESDDVNLFVAKVKVHIDTSFEEINRDSYFYVKKSLRKIARLISKYAKYMNNQEAHAELLLYFCKRIKEEGFLELRQQSVSNIYYTHFDKLETLIGALHEDLQYDYRQMVEKEL